MQARSSIRQSDILIAARRLLLERGFERMTVAMVAKNAGASLGSVTHFFKTKERIAAAVANQVIEAIASDAQTALHDGGRNLEQSIRSLIAAALAWPKKFPRYRELVAYDLSHTPSGTRSVPKGMQARLETLLADWARPRILDGSVVALSSAELFAIVLGPALCDISGPVVRFPTDGSLNWADFLGWTAIRAIRPAKQKAGRLGEQLLTQAGQPDLFGGALAPRQQAGRRRK
jgi:AcrR family transcriptional regulator